jgi:N-acetylglutamate synthase-like GNAT family acetyltransferase
VRQEDENLWMIYPPAKPRPHFLNRTALTVLESCDGSRDPDELVRVVQSKFSKVPADRVKTDVLRCLHLFRTLGLIHWEPPTAEPTSIDGVRVADEGDFAPIAEFIKNRMGPDAKPGSFNLNYLSIAGDIERVYQDIAIRTRQFHFVELFFLSETDGQVRGVAGLRPTSSVGQTMMLSVLVVDDGPDGADVARGLFRGMIDHAGRLGIVRVKMSLIEDVIGPEQRGLLEGLGFSYEARLLDEVGDGKHVELWSRRTGHEAQPQQA